MRRCGAVLVAGFGFHAIHSTRDRVEVTAQRATPDARSGKHPSAPDIRLRCHVMG